MIFGKNLVINLFTQYLSFLLNIFIEDKRNDDEYIRNTLKTRLREELEYLEEKKKSEMEAKEILGEEYADKVCDINDARKEALISGQMNISLRI